MPNEIQEIMTFKTGASLFGVPIQNVLSILGETDKLFCKAFSSKEALGIMEYRGIPVAVIDLAIAGNITSGKDRKNELAETLLAKEQDHIDWVDALEKTIINDESCTLAKDPKKCEFGLWYETYSGQDEDFNEILADFDEPHKQIHALADQLFSLKKQNDEEQCREILITLRDTALAKFRGVLARAVTHLRSSIKPVFIYLTMDGSTPCAAIRVDEIADVQEVEENSFVSMKDMALPQVNNMDYIKGFLKLGERGDCLLIDVKTLTNHRDMDVVQEKSA